MGGSATSPAGNFRAGFGALSLFFHPVCGYLSLRPHRDRAVTVLSLQKAIMEPLDHKNLDKDVPYFSEVVRWVRGAPGGVGTVPRT